MKLKKLNRLPVLLLIVSLSSLTVPSFAQYVHFVESGKIEFEKKVNVYAKLKDRITKNSTFWQKIYDEYRRTQPQFATSKSTLSFSNDKSVYQLLEEGKSAMSFLGGEPWLTINNTVYRNFNTDSVTTVKKVFEEDYVVKDKRMDVLWKMTNEVREIAGYQCRRANGLVMDSIYVVAFFSEEIVPSGGPESFSGLPGMILGVALPHENVTWFATKVEVIKQLPPNAPTTFPRKAKQFTRKDYEADLQKNMKNWGERGIDALKAFML